MKLLHDFTTGTIVRWCWGTISARNGHEWARTELRFAHLYPLHRREAPDRPIGERLRYGWTPWSNSEPGPIFNRPTYRTTNNIEGVLNPLCGRLPTQSRNPSFRWRPIDWGPAPCPNCQNIAERRGLQPTHQTRVITSDPWHNMTAEERNNQLDPISGR